MPRTINSIRRDFVYACKGNYPGGRTVLGKLKAGSKAEFFEKLCEWNAAGEGNWTYWPVWDVPASEVEERRRSNCR